MGALYEDQYTFMIIFRSVLLRKRRVSDKPCGGNQNTHFMFNKVLSNIVSFMRECGDIECTAGQATDDSMAHRYLRLQTHPQNM